MTNKEKKPAVRSLSAQQVEDFERLQAQIEGLHEEMQTLVRKSPNDLLNKFKLGLVNPVLRRANELLGNSYRPFADFSELSVDALPSNSDVMMILNQYLTACEALRSDHIVQGMGVRWVWVIDGKPSNMQTLPPRKLTLKK